MDRGHDPNQSLPADLLAKLSEETNVQGYLLEPQCEHSSANWTKGWKLVYLKKLCYGRCFTRF